MNFIGQKWLTIPSQHPHRPCYWSRGLFLRWFKPLSVWACLQVPAWYLCVSKQNPNMESRANMKRTIPCGPCHPSSSKGSSVPPCEPWHPAEEGYSRQGEMIVTTAFKSLKTDIVPIIMALYLVFFVFLWEKNKTPHKSRPKLRSS